MKYVRLTYIFTLMVLGVSCQSDFLDREPLDKISSSAVYSDQNLAQAFLNKIHDEIPHPLGGYYMTDCVTDNARTKSGWISSQKVIVPGLIGPSNNPIGMWHKYKSIRKANEFIEKVGESSMDESFKKTAVAEARWLRAEFYFELVKRYGDVPLITKAQTINDDFLTPRTPATDVWDFIDSELDEIDDILESKSDILNGKISKEACWALGSRAMLYAKRWEKCVDYSRRVIESGKFEMSPDYGKLFGSYGGDKEVIFEILFDGKANKGQSYDLYNLPWSYRADWGSQTNPTQELVDSYYMANGLPITDAASGYDAKKPYEGRDPRFYASVLYNGAVFKGRAMNTVSPDGPDAINKTGLHSITGYYCRKYLDEKSAIAPKGGESRVSWKMFRLGEMYLNLAEAENELRPASNTVYASVKVIRDRVNMPNIKPGLSQAEMRKELMHERRIELAFEDHRWWDLIRWRKSIEVLDGKYFHGVVVTKNDDGSLNYNMKHVVDNRPLQVFLEKHYLAPIPYSDIQKNENLTQNPGY
ncbi:membrane protein [Fulvitalea axinellae]|uniref:Membrane protein n=1 Tax=Fulvitalea axinellae TaxID=1182444 RepID=A0AAU9CXG2_9BACT|nr:membrane protein [Fulvitalea axinellae]